MKEISAEERIKRLKHSCTLNDNGVERYFYNGYEYVEIGGIKWAKCNVGAEKETDCGLYFQWGDTQGYTAEQVGSGQKYFGWADYKYGNGTGRPSTMAKYNSTDGKTVLEASDDAATANMGGSWRMPTTDEWVVLANATTSAWTENYQGSGVKGFVLTSKADSSKKLFFPAAGYCRNGSVSYVGSYGNYWSSSLYSSGVRLAFSMYFYSSSVVWQGNYYRFFGFSVRGVIGCLN